MHTMGFPDHSIDDAANRDTLAGMIETNRLWVLEEAGGAVEAVLFTEAENHPAQRAYESLGFERIGDYGMVLLDPVQVKGEG